MQTVTAEKAGRKPKASLSLPPPDEKHPYFKSKNPAND